MCLVPAEVERGKEIFFFFSIEFGQNTTLTILDFGLLASRPVRDKYLLS